MYVTHLYSVYLAFRADFIGSGAGPTGFGVGLTHNLGLDRAYLSTLWPPGERAPLLVPLAGPLPFAQAYYIREYLARGLEAKGTTGKGAAERASGEGGTSEGAAGEGAAGYGTAGAPKRAGLAVRTALRARREAWWALQRLGCDPHRYLADAREIKDFLQQGATLAAASSAASAAALAATPSTASAAMSAAALATPWITPIQAAIPSREDLEPLASRLGGRILLAREAGSIVGPGGWPPGLPAVDALHCLCLSDMARVVPSVEIGPLGSARCNRCGAEEGILATDCPYCGSRHCLLCQECSSMGESRMCRPLFIIPRCDSPRCDIPHDDISRCDIPRCDVVRRDQPVCEQPVCDHPARDQPAGDFHLDFGLTTPQESAAAALRQFISDDPRRGCLLWAVCGAGKTEVSFGAVAEVLRRGGKVLYAVPRREVVEELFPRITRAFCSASVAELHGAVRRDPYDADITVATTHQALRFNRNFDLVVLDEADAYPYRGSRMLHYAVSRAARESTKIIYMTATPQPGLKRRALAGDLALVTIPARHHGYPAPVPELVKARLPAPGVGGATLSLGAGRAVPSPGPRRTAPGSGPGRAAPGGDAQGMPRQVADIMASRGPRPLYVFVPTVGLVRDVAMSLASGALSAADGPGAARVRPEIAWTHAGDPQRAEKISRFKAGEIPVMVTTTILERGITVSGADVLVLYADYERVFDEGTLIQMAGRAGRTSEHPDGRVWFVAAGISDSMRQAVKAIRWMNQEALRLGYLKSGPGVSEPEICQGEAR